MPNGALTPLRVVKLALLAVGLAALAMVILKLAYPISPPLPPRDVRPSVPAEGKTVESRPATHTPSSPVQAPAIEFSREGLAGRLATGVERVVGPGKAQAAVLTRGDARWVCILADAGTPGRHFELDPGLRPDDFPAIKDNGFLPPPPPMARTTTSIYRSLTKTAMGYDAARGDRIIILLCPRSEWPRLALQWPPSNP